MIKTNLTALSRKYLEKKGYYVEKVEHFEFYTKRMHDMLDVGDLLALNGKELLLVQVTSRGHLASRRTKSTESEKLKLWLQAGGKFLLHGWDKPLYRWRLKEEEL